MANLVQTITYQLLPTVEAKEGQPETTVPGKVLTIRKWSATMAMSMLAQIGAMAKESFSGMEDFNLGAILSALAVAAEENQGRITMIIRKSVVDPSLSDQEILEWSPEDFLGVLAAVLKLNLSEGVRKNLLALWRTIVPQRPDGVAPAAVVNPA